MKLLNPTLHGVLDYVAAAGLVVLPFVLGLPALAQWLSVAAGLGLIAYSLCTDYRLGVLGVLSFGGHLVLDLGAAVVFFAAPTALGWDGLTAGYFYVMGAGVIAVVVLSHDEEAAPAQGT